MQPYRATPEKKEAWIQFEQKALKDGRIFESNAPFCVPGLIVEKPERDAKGNKRWRPLIDLRPLNDAVKDVCYPLPNIDELFVEHRGMKVFTKLDLKDGFHQLRLHPDSYDLTTFVTPSGMYKYHRVPQGYKNGPAEFQRIVDATIRKLRGKLRGAICVYIDDILIGAKTIKDLRHDTELVLNQLWIDGWALQPVKCTFGATEVDFLGFKMSKDGKGIQIQLKQKLTDKIMKAILQPFQEQNDMISAVQKVCGYLNYYRKFAPKMSEKIAFITKRLRKDAKLEQFSDEEIDSVKELIQEIVEAGRFALPDAKLPTVIMHDASGIGYGYIAIQELEGEPYIVNMDSRNFPQRKKEIATLDRELTGMLFAMIKLGYVIPISKATFYTDHQAILGLIRKFDGGLVHGRRGQAILMLRSSGAAFRHVPGVEMMFADAISRWKEEGSLRNVIKSYLIKRDLGMKAVLVGGKYMAENYIPRAKAHKIIPNIYAVHRKYDGKSKQPNDKLPMEIKDMKVAREQGERNHNKCQGNIQQRITFYGDDMAIHYPIKLVADLGGNRQIIKYDHTGKEPNDKYQEAGFIIRDIKKGILGRKSKKIIKCWAEFHKLHLCNEETIIGRMTAMLLNEGIKIKNEVMIESQLMKIWKDLVRGNLTCHYERDDSNIVIAEFKKEQLTGHAQEIVDWWLLQSDIDEYFSKQGIEGAMCEAWATIQVNTGLSTMELKPVQETKKIDKKVKELVEYATT